MHDFNFNSYIGTSHGGIQMSRIARKSNNKPAPTTEVAATEEEIPDIASLELSSEEKSTATQIRTTRVVFDVNATADELNSGKLVPIPNAAQVFPVGDGKSRAKGLITGAKVHAIYQDTGSSIRMDLNIHNTANERPAVENTHGRLHTPQRTDMGVSLASAEGQFTTMLNITPFEKQRFAEGASVYNPDNVASNAMVQKYGNYTAESLKEGIIPFEGEQYYLADKDHVVLNVIRNNWESLGINLEDEHVFNGRYVQVPKAIYDKVANDLKQHVLSKMPFTDLNSLTGRFSAVGGNIAQHEDGPSGKYKIVVELGLQYQVM